MGRFLIFCAGEFAGLLDPVRKDDFLLAADGGLRHLQALGLTPNGILGDFDSLGYVPDCAQVFPVEKDDTDAMLAVRKGLALGYREFILYAGLDGPRLDHTIANIQTLGFLADAGATGYLVGNDYILTVIKNGEITFPKEFTGIFSVFCQGADAEGVTVSGAKYNLEDGSLSAGFPLGVSNHFVGLPANVQVKQGKLLLLWDRKNGMPG